MWPFSRKPLVDWEMIEWMLDHAEWLFSSQARRGAFAAAQLIPISDKIFPTDGLEGHALAEHILDRVLTLMGVDDIRITLVPDESASRFTGTGNRYEPQWRSMPIGTFSSHHNEITYDVTLLERPVDLVAVLAHEVSHAVLDLGASLPPPSDEDFDELLTDFSAVFLGFGLFKIAHCRPANPQTLEAAEAARNYYTFYMSRREACAATALFAAAHGIEPKLVLRAADMDARGDLRRGFADLAAHGERLEDVRAALAHAKRGG